jgi:ATP-binding cassette subfamily B protein
MDASLANQEQKGLIRRSRADLRRAQAGLKKARMTSFDIPLESESMSDSALQERPKAKTLRPLRALLPFVRPYRWHVACALAALVIAAAALLALPVALRFVIDRGIAAEDPLTINRYFLALAGATIVFGGFAALRFYIVSWLGERVAADVRNALYRHIVRLDLAFYEVTKIGEVLSRLTTDTTLVQSITGSGFSIALRTAVQLVGALVMLVITSPALTGYIVLTIPIVIGPILIIGRRVRKLSRASQDRIADASGLAGETLGAIQLIQAYTLEDAQTARFGASVDAAYQTAVTRVRVRALLTAYAIVALFGAITFILWLGAHAVIEGSMTGGELGQFLFFAILVGGAAAGLSEQWGEVQRAAGAVERIVELLSAEPMIRAPLRPVPLPVPSLGSLAFDAVTFHYPSRPNTAALDHVSFEARRAETVALVGPSGAGKSTVFQLLLRFFDPQSGRILLDGVNIADAEPRAVRDRIGLVPQDTVIFGASVLDNVRIGRPQAADAEVEAAARAAAAHDFIERLPQRYDTFLGERGMRLSAGQRQRIAIARAILKNPPVLLLDEATSALDAESERLIQHALEGLMRNRTTLIIAHRLSTVLKADRIVLLDQGRVIDSGTHAELMRRNALYANLARLQFIESEAAA